MPCDIPFQTVGLCSHRMTHLSKSCDISLMKNNNNNKTNQVWVRILQSQHPTLLSLISEEHKNAGCLMIIRPSNAPYSWTTFQSSLRSPLPSILLPICLISTHRSSSMMVIRWKMNQVHGAAVVTLTEMFIAQARSLSPESKTDWPDPGLNGKKESSSHIHGQSLCFYYCACPQYDLYRKMASERKTLKTKRTSWLS